MFIVLIYVVQICQALPREVFLTYAVITHIMSLLLASSTLYIILLRTILIFRGQWMADILDTEVLMISRKAVGIMTLIVAYIDYLAPLDLGVNFTMYLLTGDSKVT